MPPLRLPGLMDVARSAHELSIRSLPRRKWLRHFSTLRPFGLRLSARYGFTSACQDRARLRQAPCQHASGLMALACQLFVVLASLCCARRTAARGARVLRSEWRPETTFLKARPEGPKRADK